MICGYARTSSFDQIAGLEAQVRDLTATGCNAEKIFSEHVSSVAHRPQLEAALSFLREGDTLVVTRMCRLARSTADLLRIIDLLERKGVGLKVLDFGGSEVDTRSATGRLMVTMFGALAEFERSLMLARQREGIERAKAAGKYAGRVPTARRKLPAIRELAERGMKASEIAKELHISRSSVFRLLAERT